MRWHANGSISEIYTRNIKEEQRIVFNLPNENSIRTLIKYQKEKETDKRYPRRYNEIIKKGI